MSEGYGEILINPSFLLQGRNANPLKLQDAKIDFAQVPQNLMPQNPIITKDSNLIHYLHDLDELTCSELKSQLKVVDSFILAYKDKFSNATNAQWGIIRAFTQMADESNLAECIINQAQDTLIGFSLINFNKF